MVPGGSMYAGDKTGSGYDNIITRGGVPTGGSISNGVLLAKRLRGRGRT